MNVFGKKELKLAELFADHIDLMGKTAKKMLEFFNQYLKKEDYSISETEIHKLESAADKVRRNFEDLMYNGAFLPTMRGDFLGMVEMNDRIINKFESVVDEITLQHVSIPDQFDEDFLKLTEKTIEPVEYLISAFSFFNKNVETEDIKRDILKVEQAEQECDVLERALIKKIFEAENLELAHKVQLKHLVNSIADISDITEDASDRIEIFLAKQSF